MRWANALSASRCSGFAFWSTITTDLTGYGLPLISEGVIRRTTPTTERPSSFTPETRRCLHATRNGKVADQIYFGVGETRSGVYVGSSGFDVIAAH